MFNAFCASQKCYVLLDIQFQSSDALRGYFYVLFWVYYRFLEVNRYVMLKIDSDICDDFVSPT